MPLPVIYLLTAAGVVIALWAPLEIGFAAVLGAWMLIPSGLILPGLLHIFLVDRLILAAFVLRLVVRAGQPGEPNASAYRLTPLHAAWGVLLLVGYVDGAILSSSSLHYNLDVWLILVDCCVLLVAALAVLRTVGIWRVLRPVTVVVAVAAGIGIIERITGHGWGAYLSEHVPAAYQSSLIFGLASRGGSFRSQGAAAFAVEFGWVLAMLLPIVAVSVSVWIGRHRNWGLRRQVLLLVPVGAAAVIVLSASRSAEIGAAAAIVLLVLIAGAPRRITAAVVALALAGLTTLAVDPSLIVNPFSTASSNSIESRLVRLRFLFGLVRHHAFFGLGYTGFHTVLVGLDDAYAETYGQLGILGLLAFGSVLVTSLALALRTLRTGRRSSERQLGAACVVGIVAAAAAAAGYDLTVTEQSMWTLVILGAVAVVLGEQLPVRQTVPKSPARALLPVAGAAAGALALVLSPVGWSRSYSVYLISPAELAVQAPENNGFLGTVLANTACGYLDARPATAGTQLYCTQPTLYETGVWQDQVTVQIAGPSARLVAAETRRALGLFQRLHYPTVVADGPAESGRPAWATTAPVSGAAAGFMAALVVPPLRRRRVPTRAAAVAPAYGA